MPDPAVLPIGFIFIVISLRFPFHGTRLGDRTGIEAAAAATEVFVFRTPVADLTPLAHIAMLSDLSVAGTAVRDLAPLHGLPRLRRIDLSDTAAAPEQAAALRVALPAVEILGGP